jgi:hypothetical protein
MTVVIPPGPPRRKMTLLMRAAILVLVSLTASVARAQEPITRAALVVGANAAPPGRKPLLYGHRDAENMADVLVSVGGFRRPEVQVLEDPAPEELVERVQAMIRRLAGQPHALLYFYYSGHADERALYPGGQPLSMARLRRLIDEADVSTKIGLVDACRGGGWTRAKGLVADEPFAVRWPLALDNEGSVLIASSSGLESAHESEELQGSFFTHHFAAGLRGAADANGNNEITLTEAFDYAKERTIRDTVRLTRETQHPSYAVNLRGRRDLVLANVNASPSTVELTESEGPLQLIHLDSGIQLLEIPAGRREIRLAVPPGRYLLRRTSPAGNRVKEITVRAGASNRFEEEQLALAGSDRLQVKAPERSFTIVHPVAHPPEPPVSPWIKTGAWTSAGVAALGIALGIKFGRDVQQVDRDLDPYRRFPCNGTGLCDPTGKMVWPLRPQDNAYVELKKDDGKRFEQYQYVSLGIGAAAAVASGILFWVWHAAGPDPVPFRRVALGVAPLTDGRSLGLQLALRAP